MIISEAFNRVSKFKLFLIGKTNLQKEQIEAN